MRWFVLVSFLLHGCTSDCVGRCGYDRKQCVEDCYGDYECKMLCVSGYRYCVTACGGQRE